MPSRMPELRQLIDGLALGLDALVRSYWGSEAAGFTHDVVHELERRGYEVIHVLGTTRRAATQFGALRFSIEDLFRGSSDPITVVDRLSSRILESARPVLVIENADLVDPLSLEVLRDAVDRTGCRQVIVLSEVPVADTNALVHPPVQVITLSPPSYAVIEELVRSSATNGISDAWIRRAFVESGGSPEIVTAILSDPSADDRATSALATESVLAVVGSRLSEIPAPLVACLRGIALNPGLTLHEGLDQFGSSALEPLERAGLVTASRTEGGMVLSCPPLVAAYFTATPGGSGSGSAAEPTLDSPRDVQHLVATLEVDSRAAVADARHRFEESDTPATRLALAHALWVSDATDATIAEILDQPTDDLDVLTTRAALRALRGGLSDALELLTTAKAASPEDARLLSAEALLLEIEYDRVPDDLIARATQCAPEPTTASDDLRTVLALCFTYAGLLDEAARALPASAPASLRQHHRWNLVRGVIALARLPLAEAEAAASRDLAAAIRDRDRSAIETSGYLVAMARLLRGDWSGAGSLLSGIRALGHACPFTWPLHRALRGAHAIVLAAEGKESLARALASETESMVGSTPIAGMTAPIDELVTAVLRREPTAVAEGFQHMAAEARERGYALAETLGTAVAVALEPTRALGIDIAHERPASWAGWPTFVALVTALTSGDAASASRQVGSLPADAFQFLGFLTVNSALSRLDPEVIPADLRVAADALAVRTGAGDAFRPGSGRFGDRISDREREVALLAATLSNAEIARRLGVSKRTIDHHISNALRKTGARTRIELNALVREASVRGAESNRAELPR